MGYRYRILYSRIFLGGFAREAEVLGGGVGGEEIMAACAVFKPTAWAQLKAPLVLFREDTH